MREPSLNHASFPTAECKTCDKSVLTHLAIAEDGSEYRCCVHCGTIVESGLRWVTADELEADGYFFGSAPERAGGGCGSGCGSCSARKN